MPLTNTSLGQVWSNWTYSNCYAAILNGNVVFTNTTIQNITGSGIFCTVWKNIPWLPPAFVIVMYGIIFALFAYLQSIKLFVVTCALMFALTTLLVSYGFIGGPIWMASFALLIFALVVMFISNKY